MSTEFPKLPRVATVLTLIGIAILCSLGNWQLQRLEWKQNLIAEIEREMQVPPLRNRLKAPDFEYVRTHEDAMRRGYIQGHYLYNQTLIMGPRPHNRETGYVFVTPLKMPDGSTILVQRGWLDTPEVTTHEHRPVRVGGILKSPPQSGLFLPDNDPERKIWVRPDPVTMGQAIDAPNLRPTIFYAQIERPSPERNFVRVTPDLTPRNQHLSYAVFWFCMATLLAIIYYARFIYPWPLRPADNNTGES